jgi:peptide/nickel transport system permease protein
MSSDAAAGVPSPTIVGLAEQHPTAVFLVRRTARMILALLALLVLSFSMIHLVPGDPVRAQLGPRAPTSLVEHHRAELGLDQPLPQQFADYVKGLFTGCRTAPPSPASRFSSSCCCRWRSAWQPP